MYGTCMSSEECTSKGGTADGNCAAGFGVCCMIVYKKCEASNVISANCTYITNPEYPAASANTGTTPRTCKYEFSSTSDICQIRMDFDDVVLQAPASATGACQVDRIEIRSPGSRTGPAGIATNIPALCGTLSGSHAYIETGRVDKGATMTIIDGVLAGTSRKWKIKVTQIECNTNYKAPTDCTQYFTGVTGNFKSYNYQGSAMSLAINTMAYKNCFRQEEGYCSIEYTTNTAEATPFQLLSAIATSARTCPGAFLLIPSTASTTNNGDKFCGSKLNEVSGNTVDGVILGTTSASFEVTYYASSALTIGTGFSLQWKQLPCSS
jgi:hypothetical protein